ncbi:MAG: hypothetical protein HYU36_16720 [Planctomycetes bacterium]|nr:hypothetical protein [Planctomycetota bacterium]
MRYRPPARASAFTIMEILIAIGILALGIVAVLGLFTSAVRQYKDAVDYGQVALLAEKALTDAQNYLDATAAPSEMPWSQEPHFPAFEYRVVFTPTTLSGEYKVTVTIGWGPSRKNPTPDLRFQYQQDFHTILLKK